MKSKVFRTQYPVPCDQAGDLKITKTAFRDGLVKLIGREARRGVFHARHLSVGVRGVLM